jgi:Ca2+-binding RTX toxin-like protein
VIRSDVCRGRARLVLAGVMICAVVVLWSVACPPALAQLSFSSSNQGAIKGRKPVAVVASNFNGDSGIDVATANQGFLFFGEGTDVLLGNGSGGFFADNQFEGDGGAESVAIGDFNGDGDIDLVLANCCSGDVSVLLGAGNGSFAAAVDYTVGSGCTPNSVVVGFFNSDRTPDLAVGSGGGCNVSILLGNGDGTFGAPQGVPVNLGVLPSQLATGDFNDDGNLDLVVGSASLDGSEASVLLGHGDGTFSLAPEITNAGDTPQAVAVGDFNDDTISDLAFADDPSGPNGEISIVLGNGNGTFDQQRFIQYPIGSSTTSVAVGDFNDDSVLDLATTDDLGNNDSGDVWVLPGKGDGTFLSAIQVPVDDAYAVTVGHFDANPLPDMAVAEPEPNEVTLLLNTTPLASPGPSVMVAAGGSCAPSGREGTIELALAGDPTDDLSLTSKSPEGTPAVLPTESVTLGGSGVSRTLTVRPVVGRSGTAVLTVNELSHGQVTGSVQVNVTVAGNGANTVTGGPGADIMFGQNGADTLAGEGGNDLLCGGNGPDTLSGGDGDDTLDGGRGPDRLAGGPGADRFTGGQGKDTAVDLHPAEGDTQDGTVP